MPTEAENAQIKHHHTLGMFIAMFSHTEALVASFLAYKANLDRPTARALLSGVKIDAGISLIRRLYEAHDMAIEPYIDKSLTQLSLINSVRNDIVHFGTDFSQPVPIVTNARVAQILPRIRETEVPADALADMCIDIAKINLLLLIVLHVEDEVPDDHETFRDAVESVVREKWEYSRRSRAKRHRTTRVEHR